jgi:diguanylate cyclase
MRAAQAADADRQGSPSRETPAAALSSHAVVGSMKRHGIRFTAVNYAVWQSYLGATNPTLKRAIEIVLSNGGTIDQPALNRLYTRHFCPSQVAIGLQHAAQHSLDQLAQSTSLLGGTATRADILAQLHEVEAQINEVMTASHALVARLSLSEERVALLESYLNDATRDASTDSLTGLLNRRAFDAALRNLAGDAMNSGADLSFILIDVDRFKLVNDTWGHPTGDEVLRHVAAMLTRKVRGGDLVARYGGEEFAVILGQTGRRGALRVAENLREAVSSHPFIVTAGFDTNQTEARLRITISAGLSSYVPGEAVGQWLGRADEALYRAKRAGRNRVAFAGAGPQACPNGGRGRKGVSNRTALPPKIESTNIGPTLTPKLKLPPPADPPMTTCAAE